MASKQRRRRLLKSLSHDVTSLSPGHCSNSSNSMADSNSNVSDETVNNGRLVVKRDEFICSDGHNAHLEEDYLDDESRLFGRQITSPPTGRQHLGHRKVKDNNVGSRRTLRTLFKSKSVEVDEHSVKSSLTLNDNRDIISEESLCEPSISKTTVTTLMNSIPMKPPRKREPSASFVFKNGPFDNKNQTIYESKMNENGRPRLLRSNSISRPLECDVRPRMYSRQSITHARQFSQESAIAESEAVGNNKNVETDASAYPERPQRRRHSQLVKRESVIHPPRPPRRKTPLGTASLYQPLIINGRFQNPWSTWKKPSFAGSLRWTFTSKDNSSVPNSSEELDKVLPVLPLIVDAISRPPLNGMRVTWLGHATVLVQFDNISILTDPMFSERASPLGFFGPRRIRRFPGTVYDLPKLDAVVISHNHYDHLDYNSVLLLNARFGAELHWFVPVGMRTWMHNAGCETVTELTWWAEATLHHTNDVSFCFTPAQHWCKRTPNDDNKVLWGSWCVLGPRYRFFFAGDTGYCDVFKQIGEQFGPFDLAAIPIGAYEPRWFMHNQHIDPSEAVKIHQDIKSESSCGIHWGTFILTNEHYLEPPLKLAECVRHAGLSNDDFFVLKHGESRLIHGS